MPKNLSPRRVSGRRYTRESEKTATALHYQPGAEDIAPVILAQESGDLAQQLIQIAQAKGVPVQEDASLASLLSAAGVGEEIPIEAFLIVAELFRHLYQEQGAKPPEVAGNASSYWKGASE